MRKQLLTHEDSTQAKRQHKTPCSDCPWSTKSLKGWLADESAEWWLALAHWDGTSECHTKMGPDGPLECAGLAIYRANVCKQPPSGAMKLPSDRAKVFATPMDFYRHHTGEELTSPILPIIREDPLED